MRSFGVFDPAVTDANEGVGEELMGTWNQIRKPVIVPGLRIAVYICAVMSIMLFVERVYMAFVILCVKVLGRKRYTKYNIDAVMEEMEANRSHPMVLVQVPMYNEKEVYKLSIGAACRLKWPADRIIIQVLDDSTDPNRNGYKAGALREGLKKYYVRQCDYVAIFDADFQPDPEFLVKTIPFLVSNSELALVQARWKFGKLYAFFFVRKIVAHLVTFFFYCVIFPACVLVPEVRVHKFISVYVPSTITILNALVYCGIFDIMYGQDYFWIYLFLQAIAFFVVGIGYIGTIVPT